MSNFLQVLRIPPQVKTYRLNITEILLKVVLNTINQTKPSNLLIIKKYVLFVLCEKNFCQQKKNHTFFGSSLKNLMVGPSQYRRWELLYFL